MASKAKGTCKGWQKEDKKGGFYGSFSNFTYMQFYQQQSNSCLVKFVMGSYKIYHDKTPLCMEEFNHVM